MEASRNIACVMTSCLLNQINVFKDLTQFFSFCKTDINIASGNLVHASFWLGESSTLT
jgi:hypothetical protein